jgi:glycosyltransferase involved in cell wall biosynthesis
MQAPFVTVVVPIYNRCHWVKELIGCLEQQTYPRDRYEVVIVDNGSRDGVWEWVNEYALQAPFRLHCYRNTAPEKVPAASRNFGISKATGEFVAFTDSDCQPNPDWLENLIPELTDGVGVVEGRTIPVPEDPTPPLCRIKIIDGTRSLFDTCNIAYRRDVLLEVGGFARDFYLNGYPRFYGEDLDLGYRVKERGYAVAFAPNAIVRHHIQNQTFWQWLKEPKLVFICPYIAWKHPSARRELLFWDYFLNPSTAFFDLALVCVVLAATVHPAMLLGGVPYFFVKDRERGQTGSLITRVAALAGSTVRSLITFGVLVAASIRYRSVIL